MKLTVVREDNTVIVNGIAAKVDCTDLPRVVYAIQWDDDANGWIEFTQTPGAPFLPNISIDDISSYRYLVDRWRLAQAEQRFAAKAAELTDAEQRAATLAHEAQQRAAAQAAQEQSNARQETERKEKEALVAKLKELTDKQAEAQAKLHVALDKIAELEKVRG